MAQAFNVARRLSVRNEPDLLQEDFLDDDEDKVFTEGHCKTLAEKLCAHEKLPSECLKYSNVVSTIKRKNSNRSDQAKAFAGLSPRDAANAMAAREKGKLNHAQVQRRLTTRHRKW